jgi:hypothetical protein
VNIQACALSHVALGFTRRAPPVRLAGVALTTEQLEMTHFLVTPRRL